MYSISEQTAEPNDHGSPNKTGINQRKIAMLKLAPPMRLPPPPPFSSILSLQPTSYPPPSVPTKQTRNIHDLLPPRYPAPPPPTPTTATPPLSSSQSLLPLIPQPSSHPSKANVLPVPPLPPLIVWLNELGLTCEMLENTYISLPTLQALWSIESSKWKTIRWCNITYLPERVISYLFLYHSDLYHHNDPRAPIIDHHLWIDGRDILLENQSGLRRSAALTGFIENVEFYFEIGLKLSFLTIFIYQIVVSAQYHTIQGFGDFFSILWNADTTAFNALFYYPRAHYIGFALAIPFIGGTIQALRDAYQAKPFKEEILLSIAKHFAEPPTRFLWWHEGLRWLFPFCKTEKELHHLYKLISRDANIPAKHRMSAFNLLRKIMTERGGYTKIAALHCLAKLAHGHSLQQLYLLKKATYTRETLLQILYIKSMSLDLINHKARELSKHLRAKDIVGIVQSLDAHYHKWALAHSDSKVISAIMFILTLAKTGFESVIFYKILASLITYLRCPLRRDFSFTVAGGYPDSLKNTEECFNAFVSLFNFFPGQPVDTLTRLVPQTIFNQTYHLDLSGKGLAGNVTAAILQALTQEVSVTSLNLSGNAINSVRDVDFLLAQLTTALQTLDLSNNNLELANSDATIRLASGFTRMMNLRWLSLVNNGIGFLDDRGEQEIGKNLSKLTALTVLDLSENFIGSFNSLGTDLIGNSLTALRNLTSINLSDNNIGQTGSAGIQTFGQKLSSLNKLAVLDLSDNFIDYTDSNGTQAIGQAFRFLTHLTVLNLSDNTIDKTDSNGTQIIGKNLMYLSALQSFNLADNDMGLINDLGIETIRLALPSMPALKEFFIGPIYSNATRLIQTLRERLQVENDLPIVTTPQEAHVYLAALPTTLSELSFSKKLRGIDEATLSALLQGLTRFTQLTVLDLSNNQLDEFNSQASSIISDAFSLFSNLTALNLSNNLIGNTDSDGTANIGDKLTSLRNLTSLDLSDNVIGQTDSRGLHVLGPNLSALQNLTLLDLSNNFIGKSDSFDVQSIGYGLGGIHRLTYLDLSGNAIGSTGSQGTQIFATNITAHPNLTTLDLSRNQLGNVDNLGAEALGRSLAAFTGLKRLDLSFNYIDASDSTGTRAIGDHLTALKALTFLDLSNNVYIGSTDNIGLQKIGHQLSKLTTLTYLNFNHGAIGSAGPEGSQALLSALPQLKQLNFTGFAGIQNVSWIEGASAVVSITNQRLQQSCQLQSCFGSNIGVVTYATSDAAPRFELPVYLELPSRFSVWLTSLIYRCFQQLHIPTQTPSFEAHPIEEIKWESPLPLSTASTEPPSVAEAQEENAPFDLTTSAKAALHTRGVFSVHSVKRPNQAIGLSPFLAVPTNQTLRLYRN